MAQKQWFSKEFLLSDIIFFFSFLLGLQERKMGKMWPCPTFPRFLSVTHWIFLLRERKNTVTLSSHFPTLRFAVNCSRFFFFLSFRNSLRWKKKPEPFCRGKWKRAWMGAKMRKDFFFCIPRLWKKCMRKEKKETKTLILSPWSPNAQDVTKRRTYEKQVKINPPRGKSKMRRD